jgi:uncharacterized protein (UPF0335 family)
MNGEAAPVAISPDDVWTAVDALESSLAREEALEEECADLKMTLDAITEARQQEFDALAIAAEEITRLRAGKS